MNLQDLRSVGSMTGVSKGKSWTRAMQQPGAAHVGWGRCQKAPGQLQRADQLSDRTDLMGACTGRHAGGPVKA